MDYLIDTNILIPIEPASSADIEELSWPIADLVRQIQHTGNRVVIHPATFDELSRDKDPIRREMRVALAGKYVRLENAPEPTEDLLSLSTAAQSRREHDDVDLLLLAAAAGGAVAFLVTEDAGLHAKAARIGVSDRVLTVTDARDVVRTLYEKVPVGPAPVESTTCGTLDTGDPLFDGLRARYPGFNGWWARAAAEGRRAWVVRSTGGGLAALCVVVEKPPGRHGLSGKVLKICTFKVADDHSGFRYGELLLKAVFDYAEVNRYDILYVEVGPDLEQLLTFLDMFGFLPTGEAKPNGDVILAKWRRPRRDDLASMDPFDLHVRYGPPAVLTEGVSSWLVPIQPRYHARLFPEAETQAVLLPGREAHGNSIRKAYLCRAPVRTLRRGDLLYFYKSTEQAVSVAGIVEDVTVLSDVEGIVRTAGKRTVYAAAEMAEMAGSGRDVLVVGFRQVRVVSEPIAMTELTATGVVCGPPQSIQGIGEEGAAWLATRMRL